MRCASFIAGLVLAGAAAAQGVAPSLQPGQLERQFQGTPQPRAQPPEIELPSVRQPPAAEVGATRFRVAKVIVDRGARHSEEQLAQLTGRLVDREVTLAEVYEVAAELTRRYRAEGLILTQAVVPAQTLREGVLRLLVVEGFVDRVRLEGDIVDRARVEAYAERIRETRPLTATALERHLLLMNDLAGATARATIVPSASVEGAADLLIQFSQKRISGGAAIDNRGSRQIGPIRGIFDLELTQIAGYGDRTAAKFVTSFGDRELRFGSIVHELPIGNSGGKLGFAGTAVRSTPELAQSLAQANLQTSANSAALSYQQPLTRSRAENLSVRVSLGLHDGRTELGELVATSDRIRSARLALTYDRADSWRGLNIVELELAQGINGLGAKRTGEPDTSRAAGRSDFTKLTLYAARLQSLAPRWSVLGALYGQYAFNPLFAAEQYAFGGEQFGRGYDPSELVGDSGVAAKLELRYTDRLPLAWFDSYTAYSFYDIGRVHRRASASESSDDSAAAAGLGLRFSLGRTFSGFIEAAKPLTRDVRLEGERDLRWFAGLAAKF